MLRVSLSYLQQMIVTMKTKNTDESIEPLDAVKQTGNVIRNFLVDQLKVMTKSTADWGLNSRIKRTFLRP